MTRRTAIKAGRFGLVRLRTDRGITLPRLHSGWMVSWRRFGIAVLTLPDDEETPA